MVQRARREGSFGERLKVFFLRRVLFNVWRVAERLGIRLATEGPTYAPTDVQREEMDALVAHARTDGGVIDASSIPYAASKAALHHVTKLLALALAPDVRVNAVAPGLVETPMTANWPDMLETWNTKAPMRRPAKPEDIADLVAALIANDYVTGEIIIADGGLNLT